MDLDAIRKILQSGPQSAPEGGWYAFFGQKFPHRDQTQLERLIRRAVTLSESGEAWSECLAMRTEITQRSGGITPEDLVGDPKHARTLARIMRELDSDDEDLFDVYPWKPHEILGIASAVDVPGLDPKTLLTETNLADIAEAIFMRASEAEWGNEAEWVQVPDHRRRPTERVLEADLRSRATRAGVHIQSPTTPSWPAIPDEGRPTATIHVLDKETAFAFVRRHHSQLPDPNPRGFIVAIGLYQNGVLHAVGLANHPSAGYANPRHIVDVSRIASDGRVRGASSSIMRWFMDQGPALIRPRAEEEALVVTYSLLTEVGTTYQSLVDEGLHATRLSEAKDPGGTRAGSTAGKKSEWKIHWAYSPSGEADPHIPHLFHLHRGYTAVHEGRPLKSAHFRGLATREAMIDLGRVLGIPLRELRSLPDVAALRVHLLLHFGSPHP